MLSIEEIPLHDLLDELKCRSRRVLEHNAYGTLDKLEDAMENAALDLIRLTLGRQGGSLQEGQTEDSLVEASFHLFPERSLQIGPVYLKWAAETEIEERADAQAAA